MKTHLDWSDLDRLTDALHRVQRGQREADLALAEALAVLAPDGCEESDELLDVLADLALGADADARPGGLVTTRDVAARLRLSLPAGGSDVVPRLQRSLPLVP